MLTIRLGDKILAHKQNKVLLRFKSQCGLASMDLKVFHWGRFKGHLSPHVQSFHEPLQEL